MLVEVTNLYLRQCRQYEKIYIANWRAKIGPFKIWNGKLVRTADDVLRLEFGGRKETGISMDRTSEEYEILHSAGLAAWQAAKYKEYMDGRQTTAHSRNNVEDRRPR